MGVEEIDLEEDARRYSPNRYLLDTCTLLWVTNEPDRLSRTAAAIWRTRNTLVAVSVISYWEMAIKAGKHGIDDVARWWERRVMPFVDLETIPVREEHISDLLLLPKLHKDPFDRMLIAQARVENMLLVTSDKQIYEYERSHSVVTLIRYCFSVPSTGAASARETSITLIDFSSRPKFKWSAPTVCLPATARDIALWPDGERRASKTCTLATADRDTTK